MRGQHDRSFSTRPLFRDDFPNQSSSLRVKPRRGLVQHQHTRIADERDPKRETSPHPPRKRGRGHPKRITVKTDPRRDALNHAVLFSEWNALQPRVEPQVLLHRQRVVQRVVLRANPENAVPERTNELHK